MSQSNQDLFKVGWQIISDRQVWEDRQRKFFIMRHEGLRRRNKPFPTAADLHLALIDEKVNQKKAFTLSQVYGAPKLAHMASLRQQLQETTESASSFFDFELKHRTNLLTVLDTVADTMWLRGRGIIKSYVDPFNDYRIVHESIDPLYLLMPDTANDFEDADEWIHVRQISVAKFKMDRRYFNRIQEPMEEDEVDGKIKLIAGGEDALNRLKTSLGTDFDQIQTDKEYREGYTHSTRSDTIIIWEHYKRTLGGITVTPYCPVAMDVEIRKPYGLPYKVDGKVTANLFSFPAERKDDGWYSPRGVAEKIADKEIYACKMWNAKADAITFFNTPMLTSDTPIQNPANYRQVPGEYIPGNVKAIQYGQPAISFDQEIAFARGEAEMASQSVDTSIEKPNSRGGEKRTKYEVGVAAGIAQVAQQYSGNIFMQSLAKVLAFDWGLCLAYKRNKLTYFIAEDLNTVPEAAFHDEYLITAGGSTDDWDKQQKMQVYGQLMEMFKGSPNINQDELATLQISCRDARLVKKLVLPQNQKAASEAEDETQEITSMMVTHFAAPVNPQEDHLTRIKTLLQFLQAQGMKGKQVDPLARQRIQQHLAQHMKLLQQINPTAFKQLMQQIKQQERQPMKQQPQPSAPRPLVPPMPQRRIGQPSPMRML